MPKLDKLSEIDFPIGMRNIKTASSVFACLLIYWLLGRDNSLLAVTSAIICMQSSVELSVTAGVSRLTGTAIGAGWGMLMLTVKNFFPFLLTIFLATLGVMLLIWLCNKIRMADSIIMACIIFLVIILGESGDSPFVYSFNQLLDTFIGIVVAVLINRFLRVPPLEKRSAGKAPAAPTENPPGGSAAGGEGE